MSGWWDSLFGNLPPQPKRPASRGAMLGMGNYQNMPDAKSTITDNRQEPGYWVQNDRWSNTAKPYPVPNMSGTASRPGPGYDYMLGAGPALAQGLDAEAVAPYKPSFQQNTRRFGSQPPQIDPRMGPQLPQNWARIGYSNVPSDLPPIGAHLPIAPGDPDWTPPPSPSGPHNPGGDPARPGYGSPVMPVDAASQPSYQQMIDLLQSWRTQ